MLCRDASKQQTSDASLHFVQPLPLNFVTTPGCFMDITNYRTAHWLLFIDIHLDELFSLAPTKFWVHLAMLAVFLRCILTLYSYVVQHDSSR